MSFTQTGAPTIFPMPGDDDFMVPGILSLSFGEFLFQFGLFDATIAGTTAEVPMTLTGTFNIIGSLVQVTGSGSADVPFAVLETTLAGDPASSFTAGIQGTAHLEFEYSFEVFNEIPEPASLVLLGIGLTSLAAVCAARWRTGANCSLRR